MLGGVGSCELPQPQIPSIGQVAPARLSVAHDPDGAPESGIPTGHGPAGLDRAIEAGA